jgi:3'-phosphoadenosine 5'-phosphosulfate sulfotransferase (PAPS reductase)/FAD synthetase
LFSVEAKLMEKDIDIVRIENEIMDQYVNDPNPRPWIIAFSGGKDSTTLLQLVWKALSKLKPKSRRKTDGARRRYSRATNPR